MDYKAAWDRIYSTNSELFDLYSSYWREFSNLDSWQFWVVALLFVLPLIALFFTVDRKRIFELFFFGYTIHILWTYMAIAIRNQGYLIHNYFLTPLLPTATSITASLLPVSYLLIYQYCINHNKNYYLYSTLLSAFFAFGFATLEEYIGFIDFREGMNQFHLFFIDIGIAFISYWFTKFLLRVKREGTSP